MWIMMLVMIGGMALVMIGGMVLLHQKASELSGGQPRGMQSVVALLVNRVVTRLLRAGIPVRILGNPVVLLTVPGRKTGQPRTTLVDLYERHGRRFLVSTHGADTAHWVRNLRAAGQGTLTRGRSHEAFTEVELTSEAAGRVLKELLESRLASPLGGFALRQTLDVMPGASLEDFIHVAESHPVFELSAPDNDFQSVVYSTPV
jgi:deazaflavin-dependent oxidoreductase (nitroreductase family)